MVISVVQQGGDARARVHDLIETKPADPRRKAKLRGFAPTKSSPRSSTPASSCAPSTARTRRSRLMPRRTSTTLTVDLPRTLRSTSRSRRFLPRVGAARSGGETYTMDLIGMVEAAQGPQTGAPAPRSVPRATAPWGMKADGVEYEERLERIQDVTYEEPLEDLLDTAFDKYCQEVPWANDYQLSPKSVLRYVGKREHFKGATFKLGIARSEGILLPLPGRETPFSRYTITHRGSATSACATLSRGWALWCARSTRAWWTSGRTPALRQPSCRAATGHRRGRG